MSSKPFTNFLVIFTLVLLCLVGSSHTKCDFKAIFNFGDSNSDTGGFWAAFPAQSSPFGMTYFKKPTGRATDGRLIVDFLGNRTNFIIFMIWLTLRLLNVFTLSLVRFFSFLFHIMPLLMNVYIERNKCFWGKILVLALWVFLVNVFTI